MTTPVTPLGACALHRYKNTYKQTLCLEMLERGFHRSFAEIFELIKQQADHRVAAGPDSELWSQRLLTQEPDKLDVMRDQLVEAESAMLLGNFYQSVCVSSLCLSLCI